VRVTPVQVSGLRYSIAITDRHLKIGCEFHTFKEWENFTDKEILSMEGEQSLEWWKSHKTYIMGIVRANRE